MPAVRRIAFSNADESAIASSAARYAREWMSARGWSSNSSGSVQPINGHGYVGLKTTVDYVNFQNNGIKPFLMRWVEGRVVPLHDRASGQTNFRYGRGVGQPGWVTLPGGVRKWRDQKWRHPGLKGEHFLESALSRAIDEAKPTLRQRLIDVLMGVA